jgi:endonuclease YncB( thermonuclease family)
MQQPQNLIIRPYLPEDEPQAVDFNALMLEKGLARVDEKYLPDHLQHYRELEKTAQENKIGI